MTKEIAKAVFPYSSYNAQGLFFFKEVVNSHPTQWNITSQC